MATVNPLFLETVCLDDSMANLIHRSNFWAWSEWVGVGCILELLVLG